MRRAAADPKKTVVLTGGKFAHDVLCADLTAKSGRLCNVLITDEETARRLLGRE